MMYYSSSLVHRRVVEGTKVLQKLEDIETYNERPKELCQVSNCGVLVPAASE